MRKMKKIYRKYALLSIRMIFGTYFPKTGEWNRKKIMPNGGYCRTIWEKTGEGNDWREQEKINILQNEEDLGKIRDFAKRKFTAKNTGGNISTNTRTILR